MQRCIGGEMKKKKKKKGDKEANKLQRHGLGDTNYELKYYDLSCRPCIRYGATASPRRPGTACCHFSSTLQHPVRRHKERVKVMGGDKKEEKEDK
jgi:hypothetical protein